ncbi:protein-glutamate O-methyltransferase CheR [Vibrio vulnificus]|uniref:CheR family methyltransferase n=1 Tax=Vibrio vulnificus TaxID=672 RepID=UPI001A1EEA27|nr:protein-glutamate O-methyltransferase CheR [Vibrio vulnificus]EIJ0970828.1 protein-glutamate O-methyltransferase CheR [Vibrio vulnificus]EIO4057591.1 protein-glutamate O-methyltransferase CheR [Vibrio vulnificus]EJB5267985.1 protein-glutamate O-methyltransferase CheR [Vibrio vulnificus]MCU8138072.1 protein-glutamate O-methyltransferase CheR [Vibrio vulnificus]MDK2601228.1 protein-glutamate O-methyltransferase CheR [Vibrio vulnificus]
MGRVLSSEVTLEPAQEFELTDKDFKYVQWFIHKHVGIFLSDHKRAMVYGRLSRKLREKGLKRFADYRECIENNPDDRMAFINALTTNKTHFFREIHHIEFLESQLFPYWRDQRKKKVRIWSAGCSTGEEPYSYLASIQQSGLWQAGIDCQLLATDLDTNVLQRAQQGIYEESALECIPTRYLKGNFLRGKGAQAGNIKVKECLKQNVAFRQLNLLDAWPMQQKFDLISCRNVMIYFDKPTQQRLIERFYHQLQDDGVLFLGHSESVGSDCQLFKHLGKTIYIKA